MMLAFRTPRRLASWTTPSLWKRFFITIIGNLHNIKLDKNQVEEVVEAISEAVSSEIETELINASHTNVLLLRQVRFHFGQMAKPVFKMQVFGQGEKWHLNLETDLSELENR